LLPVEIERIAARRPRLQQEGGDHASATF
jgi:hypothetical protein